MKPCKVTAEIGAVHLGNMDRAKELIRLAKMAEADYVKFQKRNPIECVPKALLDAPHPNEMFSYGNTYLEHRKNLELSVEQHEELQDYCYDVGIGYSISVFDMTSAREVAEHLEGARFVKVPSACNHNRELMDFLFDNTNFDVHISLGMASKSEIEDLIAYINKKGVPTDRFLLYHCTSEYPCPFERLYLEEISNIKSMLPHVRVGYSNHGKGIATDIAAYTLGAEWIERHFVDDRMLRHTDASASLEPQGLHKLCRDLKAVHKAIQCKEEVSPGEIEQRKKLRVE